MLDNIRNVLSDAADALSALRADDAALASIEAAAELLTRALIDGHQVFSCGNGGSMCDAMHFAEELSGRFREDRRPLPAAAISDPSHISCTANDYGYEYVFSRYIEAHGKSGDVMVGFSTSGSSKNVIRAAQQASESGMQVVTLTGRRDSELARLADIAIITPAGGYADRVQELHIKIVHILIESIERSLFPENYS